MSPKAARDLWPLGRSCPVGANIAPRAVDAFQRASLKGTPAGGCDVPAQMCQLGCADNGGMHTGRVRREAQSELCPIHVAWVKFESLKPFPVEFCVVPGWSVGEPPWCVRDRALGDHSQFGPPTENVSEIPLVSYVDTGFDGTEPPGICSEC